MLLVGRHETILGTEIMPETWASFAKTVYVYAVSKVRSHSCKLLSYISLCRALNNLHQSGILLSARHLAIA